MTDRPHRRPRTAKRAPSDAATHVEPAAAPVRGRAAVRAPAVAAPKDAFGLDLDPAPDRQPEFEAVIRRQLELIGEDPDREGLVKTPQRVANSLTWLTHGYDLTAEQVIGDALFEESHSSMVMVRDIELYSMCEHHMLPFFGRAHIAYVPDGRIVGLSKLPRVVEVFARRLQVQERLTEEIAGALERVLRPRGVGVVLECAHLCMMMRGVQKQSSKTVTSAVRGIFRTDAKTRDEFLRLAHAPSSRD